MANSPDLEARLAARVLAEQVPGVLRARVELPADLTLPVTSPEPRWWAG